MEDLEKINLSGIEKKDIFILITKYKFDCLLHRLTFEIFKNYRFKILY